MSEHEITKIRICEECAEIGNERSRLFYAGCTKISPTFTLVAFSCEHGHNSKVEHATDLAERIIKHERTIAHTESARRDDARKNNTRA